MREAVPSLPQYFLMAWCLVKHRNNFTFFLIEDSPVFPQFRPADFGISWSRSRPSPSTLNPCSFHSTLNNLRSWESVLLETPLIVTGHNPLFSDVTATWIADSLVQSAVETSFGLTESALLCLYFIIWGIWTLQINWASFIA